MTSYPSETIIVSIDDITHTVHLKFIEEFSFDKSPASKTVAKLKDDYCFGVRTISGKEHTVSTKFICETFRFKCAPEQFAQNIYDKWLWMHR